MEKRQLWSVPQITEIEVKMTEGYWTKEGPGIDGYRCDEEERGKWHHNS